MKDILISGVRVEVKVWGQDKCILRCLAQLHRLLHLVTRLSAILLVHSM